MKCSTLVVLALLVSPLLVGCGKAVGGSAHVDPAQLEARRTQFLLTQEPRDVLGVIDLHESLTPGQSVTIIGQIGGVENPWSQDQAAFFMTDPAALAEVESHSAHECEGCAFCKKGQHQVPLALVQFVDQGGAVVPIDARTLFELRDKELVVVRGTATMDDLGHLVIAADGLYIRR